MPQAYHLLFRDPPPMLTLANVLLWMLAPSLLFLPRLVQAVRRRQWRGRGEEGNALLVYVAIGAFMVWAFQTCDVANHRADVRGEQVASQAWAQSQLVPHHPHGP